MKVVLTLFVRDAEDILEANLDYHLRQGIDHILAIEHASSDRTAEILESYQARGVLTLVARWPASLKGQDVLARAKTALSRLAAQEHQADWVLPIDADEFLWPASGNLKAALSLVPANAEAVQMPVINFVFTHPPREAAPLELTVRVANDGTQGAHAAHRAVPDVVLDGGHHRPGRDASVEFLSGWDSAPSLKWAPVSPIRVFHFPVRSAEQCARHASYGVYRDPWVRDDLLRIASKHTDVSAVDPTDPDWRQGVVAQGIAEGTLLVDERLARFIGTRAFGSEPDESRDCPQLTAAGKLLEIDKLALAEMLESQALVLDALARREAKLRLHIGRLRLKVGELWAKINRERKVRSRSWHRLGRGL